MAENKNETPEVVVEPATEEVEPTRLQNFVNKHPRAAKVVAITGGVTALIGSAHIAKTVSARRHHIQEASDHAKEALSELSSSVSPEPQADPEA